MKHFIVALTGASGHGYALRLLHKLLRTDCRIELTISEAGCVALGVETDVKLKAKAIDVEKLIVAAGLNPTPQLLERVTVSNPRDIGAPMASGSNRHDGMIVVPCSMGTLARIANGLADDLIARSADVALKERRRLILVTREMPLSLIHLRNMQQATKAGAIVMHACPHFYHRPQTVEEVLDTVVDRVLDHLDVPVETRRWKNED